MAEVRKKRIHVGRFDYTIDETKNDVAAVVEKLKAAVQGKALVDIAVLDDNDRQLTLYLNGELLDSWSIDTGIGPPRPMEVSSLPISPPVKPA